ncbi:MAG TPA: thioredoxin domain-containing protein [Chitinophagaceae bacterium]|jgi:hypothetical protein|nr:thioredoxin domain-containing protein [Chitinophagaceae bacterium]HNJ57195.1 thioredoxin domain-containing protein [Chitinophagaceae bacterium]HNK90984.1 thioredoxin domain-containing protein [Chitinophagales bacterium]
MFWNNYPHEVKAVIRFLEILKIKVNRDSVNQTLQSHPDWPSLLCISDSLKSWQIQNEAFKIETLELERLEVPFIAYMPKELTPFAIVTKINETKLTIYYGNYNKPLNILKKDFLNKWDGTILIANKEEFSGEQNFKMNKRKQILKRMMSLSLISLVMVLISFYLFRTSEQYEEIGIVFISIQYFILLCGAFISTLLLQYEIFLTNHFLDKVCGSIKHGNCSAILKSKGAKFLNLLSWSDVGFIYFGGSLLILVTLHILDAIHILAIINLVALPYILFSVYYQWKVLKQWCILCLIIQGLLLAGFLNVFFNNLLFVSPISKQALIEAAILYLMTAFALFLIKPLFVKIKESKDEKIQLLRLKFNTDVFTSILEKQKSIELPPDGLGILLGNPHAENEIIKVCNPYCNPCRKAHQKIGNILHKNKNIRVRLIFNATNKPNDFRAIVVKHFLALYSEGDNIKIQKALNVWYNDEYITYEKFSVLFPKEKNQDYGVNEINSMDNWCKTNEISFTPTFFIKGKQIPNMYNIEDINYFLME